MMKEPTYTAKEIKELANNLTDAESLKILSALISEEIDLYDSKEDVALLMEASFDILTRLLLLNHMKL